MSPLLAIAARDFRAHFLAPTGYLVTALFLLATAIVFMVRVLEPGGAANLRPVFDFATWVLLFLCPAITMHVIAEERRIGTWELLTSTPVSTAQVVGGKFLASMGFLAVLLAPLVLPLLVLEWHGRPDWGEAACGVLGLLLLGGTYLAGGLLASAVSPSQLVAFLLSLFGWVLLGMAVKMLPRVLGETSSALLFALDPDLRVRDFAIGLIDTANIVYFGSLMALLLGVTVLVLSLERLR